MNLFDQLKKPTLLLNEERARNNIQRMASKARQLGVRFRPHFKTHQSAAIGEWFREEGVTAITVSSVDMAAYFAAHGWEDITIAFPVNWREISAINTLAGQVHLGLLVESPETAAFLRDRLAAPADVWIKIDVGNKRTGLAWDAPQPIQELLEQIRQTKQLRPRGLLTHAGHTYHPGSPDQICSIYHESVSRINAVRDLLNTADLRLEVSVGDTPGCSKCADLGAVEEIRPGNFVFYDAQQLIIEACSEEDIAVALACPVVARHPDRGEIVIYGGAIHLSKDLFEQDGHTAYGLVSLPEGNGWSSPLPGAFVSRLSQEHGVVTLRQPDLDRVQTGDFVCVIPAHSCLTLQAMREYLTLDGKVIPTML